jgi:hypothetical protein
MVVDPIEKMAGRPATTRGGHRGLLGLFLCLALLLPACGGDRLPAPHIVAQIEDQQMRYSDFESYLLENSVDSGLALASDVLSELFDQFLDEEIVGELEAGAIPVEQITAYYRDHGQEFELEERVRLRQVLVEDRVTAEEVHRSMLTGTPFEEVLGDAESSSAAVWGDEGELSPGDLPPALADTIFALEPGEVSDIVAADYGFHIFQVVERLPPEQMELAAAEERIRQMLRRELVDDGLEELVAEARERYNVQVFRRNIPFNYAGAY